MVLLEDAAYAERVNESDLGAIWRLVIVWAELVLAGPNCLGAHVVDRKPENLCEGLQPVCHRVGSVAPRIRCLIPILKRGTKKAIDALKNRLVYETEDMSAGPMAYESVADRPVGHANRVGGDDR